MLPVSATAIRMRRSRKLTRRPRRSDPSMRFNPEVAGLPRFSIYQIIAVQTRVRTLRTDLGSHSVGDPHADQTAIAVADLRRRPRLDHAERRTRAISTVRHAPY